MNNFLNFSFRFYKFHIAFSIGLYAIFLFFQNFYIMYKLLFRFYKNEIDILKRPKTNKKIEQSLKKSVFLFEKVIFL